MVAEINHRQGHWEKLMRLVWRAGGTYAKLYNSLEWLYVPPGYVYVLFSFFLLNILKQVIILSSRLATLWEKGNKPSQSYPAPSRLNDCQKARSKFNMQEKHQDHNISSIYIFMMNMHVEICLEVLAHFGDVKTQREMAKARGWSPGSQPQNFVKPSNQCVQSHFCFRINRTGIRILLDTKPHPLPIPEESVCMLAIYIIILFPGNKKE